MFCTHKNLTSPNPHNFRHEMNNMWWIVSHDDLQTWWRCWVPTAVYHFTTGIYVVERSELKVMRSIFLTFSITECWRSCNTIKIVTTTCTSISHGVVLRSRGVRLKSPSFTVTELRLWCCSYSSHSVSASGTEHLRVSIVAKCFRVDVGFMKAGGFYAVMQNFMSAVPNTTIQQRMLHGANGSYCGVPPHNSLHLVRSADDQNLPWPGVFFGLAIISVWYWCTDQVWPAYTLLLRTIVTPNW